MRRGLYRGFVFGAFLLGIGFGLSFLGPSVPNAVWPMINFVWFASLAAGALTGLGLVILAGLCALLEPGTVRLLGILWLALLVPFGAFGVGRLPSGPEIFAQLSLGAGLLVLGLAVAHAGKSRGSSVTRHLAQGWLLLLAPVFAFALGELASFSLGGRMIGWQAENAKVAAAPIILAAEKYGAEKEVYPERIEELVPAYLAIKPRAPIGLWGGEYELGRSWGGGFYLHFRTLLDGMWTYDSGGKRWTYSTRL